MKLLYCSFADDHQFLGAVILVAKNAKDACERTTKMGCNPGGEMVVIEVPRSFQMIPRSCRNRLLSKKELDDFFGDMHSGTPPKHAEVICDQCNTKPKKVN